MRQRFRGFVFLLLLLFTSVFKIVSQPSVPTALHPLLPVQPVRGDSAEYWDSMQTGIVLESAIAFTNTYVVDYGCAVEDRYLTIDAETWLFHSAVSAYGIDGIVIGGEVFVSSLHGGILDPIISTFHSALNLENAGRELRPDGEVYFFSGDETGNESSDQLQGIEDQPGFEALVLGGSVLFYSVFPSVSLEIGRIRVAPRLSARWVPIGRSAFQASILQVESIISFIGWRGRLKSDLGLGINRIIPVVAEAGQLYVNLWLPAAWYQIAWTSSRSVTFNGMASVHASPFDLDHPRTDGAMIVIGSSISIPVGRFDISLGFTEELFPYAAPDFGVFTEVESNLMSR